ncbi:MAG: hypothetical protein WCD53_22065, partial [Microcoleus sp.]
ARSEEVCHWAGDRAKLRTEENFDRRKPSNFLEEIVSPRSQTQSPKSLLNLSIVNRKNRFVCLPSSERSN